MTRETLQQCRQAAIRVDKMEKRIKEHKASAGSIGSMRHGDLPRGRSEPLSPQESYMEKLELMQEELEKRKKAWEPLMREVVKQVMHLSWPQKNLISLYYVFGKPWDIINKWLGLSRQQSCYEVRKALKKILENS